MKKFLNILVFSAIIFLMQACATTSKTGSLGGATLSDMGSGAPNVDYIYRAPSYQISHGGFRR